MNTFKNTELVDLALELATCEKEAEVIKILESKGLWNDETLWRNYGDMENNYSSIGNQMESADAALTEKIINCCDSMLMLACQEKGIDPESDAAPKSINQAISKFFGVKEGVISYLSESERSELAKNIGLVATGGKTNPNFTIFDKGLGQSPSQFAGTFMSLNASNKVRIPFVQGKFNMGSTGALPFCGSRNMQLIISKKNPSIASNLEDGDQWGLTVVRRDPPTGQMKTSVFRYLAPDDGNVVSFKTDSLEILPKNGSYPDAYQSAMVFGTFIKLFEYDIGSGLRTNILLDLYNRLNLLLPRLYLPIRLYERRDGYNAHSYETTLAGLTTRVELDRSENLEPDFPTSSNIQIDGVNLKLDIYAFKKRDKGTAKEKYASSEGVVFSLNGQAHGFLSKDFYSRRKTGMDYLASSLLVHVDCSNIDGVMRETLFMNSRDRLRNGQLKKRIETKLESIISSHEGLKALREKRKRETLATQIGEDKPLAEILEKVIKNSKALSDFLMGGTKIPTPFKNTKHESEHKYEGKQFPTFYEPVYPHPSDKPRPAEKGRSVRLQFKTDAENQYFTREIEPGTLSITCPELGEISSDDSLWNGRHNFTIDLPNSIRVGKTICINLIVDDDTRPIPFSQDVYLHVVEKKIHKTNSKRKKPTPPSPNPGDDVVGNGFSGLPAIYPVKREKWDEYGFDKLSALTAIDSGGKGFDFYYNQDNAYLLQEQKTSKDVKAELLGAQFSTALVLIGMAVLGDKSIEEDKKRKQLEYVSQVLAPILLPMVNGLGSIDTEKA